MVKYLSYLFALMACLLAGAAFSQTLPDKLVFTLTQQQAIVVQQALLDQPYKVAAPLLMILQQQISAQTVKPAAKPVPQSPPKAVSKPK